jgi:hypothetical protein
VALLPYEDVLTLAVVSQSPQEKGLKQEPVRELVLESELELAVTKQQHPYPRLQCSAFPTHTHTHTHTHSGSACMITHVFVFPKPASGQRNAHHAIRSTCVFDTD